MAETARRRATYADLEAVPSHRVAELISGALHTQPRPAGRHVTAQNSLSDELTSPFQKGRGGPGGWVFMSEPELHLGDDVVVPDLVGWRRERLPTLPETSYIATAPDWVCEILSPSKSRIDRGPKRQTYALATVPFLWLFDPVEQTLESFTLVAGQWLLTGTATGAGNVSLPPFDAISFPFATLIPFDEPKPDYPSDTPQG